MGQLAFFSAETDEPGVADLAGLLAGPGQSASTKSGTRVSVVVADVWRAQAIAAEMRATGLDAEVTRSDEGSPLARTASISGLDDLHRRWFTGAVKTMPAGWVPTPRALRFWVLAAGREDVRGQYLLGLDPHCPQSHAPLATALMRAGIAPTLVGTRSVAPALRVSGRRRLSRLAEYIGVPPAGAPASEWPGAQ
ncbi:hypothetical protein ACPXB3_07085 [Gordonia sp. DT219]|uniref:hypothetical protein n=1 Tax=Gordonia sp. DT219 TaxID=3416658 RepID=UPI003CF7F106